MAKDRLDRIEETLDRVAREQEEFAKEMRRLEEQFEKQSKKTDEQLRKTDEQLRKTDEQLRKTDEQLRRALKKTDEQLRETSAELKDFIGIQKEITRRLEDTVGRFAEGLLLPSAIKFFEKLGLDILGVYQRARKTNKATRETLEVDVLCLGKMNKKNGLGQAVGKRVAFVIEAKSNLKEENIEPFISKQIERFRDFFDEYSDYVVIGGIGGISVESKAKEKAEKEGLYVFCPSGDNLVVINSPNFKPKVW